jgi:dihydrolipoamide dehydrogenase
MEVSTAHGTEQIYFDSAVVATGATAIKLPIMPEFDPRVLDSAQALQLRGIPRRLLVVGAGIIGLEMATIYSELGASTTLIEAADQILPIADRDIADALLSNMEARFAAVHLGSQVSSVLPSSTGLTVRYRGAARFEVESFDSILVAVGRRPNALAIGIDACGVTLDDRNFIRVDAQQRTNIDNIFAVGDVAGQPMLAHKAARQGRVAAEALSGVYTHYSPGLTASVVYSNPEVAWVGLTEREAIAEQIPYQTRLFSAGIDGNLLAFGQRTGAIKLIFSPATGTLLGVAVIGPSAGHIIGEAALAIESHLTVHEIPRMVDLDGFQLGPQLFSGGSAGGDFIRTVGLPRRR